MASLARPSNGNVGRFSSHGILRTNKLQSNFNETFSLLSYILQVKGPNDHLGNPTVRPYTPTSTDRVKGTFDLVIKSYPNGIVSSYFNSLNVGDKIEVKGPILKFAYSPNMKKSISMICGGSGLTPMLQVINEIISNPADKTQVHLIFSNTTEEDIILKKELDIIASKHSNILVNYVVSKPASADWKGLVGRVNADMIHKLPQPTNETMVLVCGPPGFMETVSIILNFV